MYRTRYERRLEAAAAAAALPGAGVGQAPAQAQRTAPAEPRPAEAAVQLPFGCTVTADVLMSRSQARQELGGDADLDTWADFLERFYPGGATFLTLSYSDEGAERFKAYRPAAVFGDATRFLTRLNYEGPAFFAAEEHRWRKPLHLHGLIHPLEKPDRLRLMAMWEAKRGWARALPATAGAFPYVCKYALKRNDSRGDFITLDHLPVFKPWSR